MHKNYAASAGLELLKKSLEDLVLDHVSGMERQGKAPGYIEGMIKSVKSWLSYNEIKLNRKERDDLAEHQRESEIIQRKDKDRPMPKETKPEFKDRQLEEALEYLRGQLKVVDK